ncbi:hypothetical protein BN59_02749 [Legionella massiliensis]|uniref:Uncharacterized protein n=1 Tax=Legionella massiliensis TaxID=1034943 RepID=A0A078L2W6_9GAMM|nr:hypothetical protein BN59_02749 [Legionella massiliensis]CEE14177.1 hypothetical protein BN1094_02749 [Legionella massiliensis]
MCLLSPLDFTFTDINDPALCMMQFFSQSQIGNVVLIPLGLENAAVKHFAGLDSQELVDSEMSYTY